MKIVNRFIIRAERMLHHKIKEFIAKSLVYFFTIKEMSFFSQEKYKNFEHVLDSYNYFLNIAHRGFSGNYPENTILSFKKAIELGVDMIELDVTITKDNEIVVFHDVDFTRLGGTNKHIRDMTFSELNKIDIGCLFDTKFSGEKVPKLTDVFEILGDKTLLNIEVKHEASSFVNRNLENKLIKLIRNYKLEKRVIVSSFNPMIVNRFRKMSPDLSTAYLITQTLTPILMFLLKKINVKYISADFKYLNKKNINSLKKDGIKVKSFTLNSYGDYEKALDLGVDGIFTDYPNKLSKFLIKEID